MSFFFFLFFRLQKRAIDFGSSEKPCKKIRLWAHSERKEEGVGSIRDTKRGLYLFPHSKLIGISVGESLFLSCVVSILNVSIGGWLYISLRSVAWCRVPTLWIRRLCVRQQGLSMAIPSHNPLPPLPNYLKGSKHEVFLITVPSTILIHQQKPLCNLSSFALLHSGSRI